MITSRGSETTSGAPSAVPVQGHNVTVAAVRRRATSRSGPARDGPAACPERSPGVGAGPRRCSPDGTAARRIARSRGRHGGVTRGRITWPGGRRAA
jgi:hypothetical protein